MKKSFYFALLAALLLPLSFSLIWGVMNHAYPGADPGFYFIPSQRIFYAFNHGWLEGLKSVYFDRLEFAPPKPVLLPAVGSLFLGLTGGDALWTVRLTGLLFFVIFLGFTFLGFNLFLTVWESAFATALLGLVPSFIHSSRFFGSELPGLSLSVAALYWLWLTWVAPMESSRKYARRFGIVFGLGLCFRPTELLTLLFLPIMAWVATGLRECRVRVRDVLVCVAALIPLIALLSTCSTLKQDRFGIETAFRLIMICGSALLARSLRKPLKLEPALNSAFTWSYLIFGLWYAPYLNALFTWIFGAAFGPLTVAARAAYNISGWRVFANIWSQLGGIPLLCIFLAGLVSVVASPPDRRILRISMLGLGAILFPTFIGLMTLNPSDRYYLGSVYLLCFMGLAFALTSKEKKFRTLSHLAVGAAVAYSLVWNVQAIAFPRSAAVISVNPHDDYLSGNPGPTPDRAPQLDLINGLKRFIPSASSSIGMMRLRFPDGAFGCGFPGLTIAARDSGLDWGFQQVTRGSAGTFDYYLLGPVGGTEDSSDPENYYFDGLFSGPQTGWERRGWKLIATVPTRQGEHTASFLLLQWRKGDVR